MMWQFLALFRLRWTLFRRGWSRHNAIGFAVLAALFAGGGVISLALSVALYWAGEHLSEIDSPLHLALLLNIALGIYFFCYLWGILMDIHRTDLMDYRKMLFLPISLPGIFLINFMVSVLSPLPLFTLPCIIGLLWGLAHGYGPVVIYAGLPNLLLLLLALGAWAYYLRGKIAILMENKRRRRIVFMLLPLCFVALGQMPALISHLATMGNGSMPAIGVLELYLPWISLADTLIPVLWPAHVIMQVAQGTVAFPALLCTVGLALWMFLGLKLGYRSTMRHYLGVYSGLRFSGNQESGNATIVPVKFPVTARRLPLVADDTAAATVAFFQSYVRHPHVMLLLIMPLCMGSFLIFMYRTGAYGEIMPGEGTWLPVAVLIWPFLNFSFFMFNLLGVDANALPALMLFPVPRYRYLLAKNLALAPFVLGLGYLFLILGVLFIGADTVTIFMCVLLVLHLFLLFSLTGNFVSLFFPGRIGRDALRAPANRIRMLLFGLLCTLLGMLLTIPTILCIVLQRFMPLWLESPIVPFIGPVLCFLLLILTGLGYQLGLTHAGDLFTAREQGIYAVLNRDRE